MGQALACSKIETQNALDKDLPGKGKAGFHIDGINPGKNFEKEYQLGSKISAKVCEVRSHITKMVFVAYCLPKSQMPVKDGQAISKKLNQLVNFEHPNVCRLYEGFDDKRCIYLIYDKLPKHPLFDVIATHSETTEQKVADIVYQLTKAAVACGEAGLVHGCLAPKNIFLTVDQRVVVTDLGLVDLVKPDPFHKLCVDALSFMAPEMLSRWHKKAKEVIFRCGKKADLTKVVLDKSVSVDKNASADIWSVGCVMFKLLTGNHPYRGKSLLDTVDQIMGEKDVNLEPKLNKVSSPAKSVILRVLQRKPSDRMSGADLLQNPWFNAEDAGSHKPLDKEIFSNLTSVQNETRLKKFVMEMVSTHIPADKIKDIERTLDQIDENNDGFLTLKELKSYLIKHPELGNLRDIERNFKEIDVDGGGTISLREFVAATLDTQEVLVQSVLWDTFKAMDADQSGTLTKAELKKVVSEVSGRLGQAHIDRMMHTIDREVKQEITFDDFCDLMTEEGARYQHSAMCSLFKSCRG